jgi:hypothetical protein
MFVKQTSTALFCISTLYFVSHPRHFCWKELINQPSTLGRVMHLVQFNNRRLHRTFTSQFYFLKYAYRVSKGKFLRKRSRGRTRRQEDNINIDVRKVGSKCCSESGPCGIVGFLYYQCWIFVFCHKRAC